MNRYGKARAYVDNILDINQDPEKVQMDRDVDPAVVNKMVFSYISSYFFKLQSLALNKEDSLIVKRWTDHIIEAIDVDGDIDFEILDLLEVNVDDIYFNDVLESMILALKRLKIIYLDLFVYFVRDANNNAFSVIESMYEGIISYEDLESIFDDRLDISLSLMNKMNDFEEVEIEILQDIAKQGKYSKVRLIDINNCIEEVNSNIEDTEIAEVQLLIYQKDQDNGFKRIRLGSLNLQDYAHNYLIYYMIIDKRFGMRRVRYREAIYDYNSYQKFLKDMDSGRREINK